MLRNVMGEGEGVYGSAQRYGGVWSNVISIMKGWRESNFQKNCF